MDIKEIREYLPHRYPFLLIDRIIDLQVGEQATALKNVSVNEPFFNGHFPDEPIMPGVLIIEAMAQTAGILGFVTQKKRPSDGYIYLLCGVDNTRFKRQVVPGDQLRITAKLVAVRRNIFKFTAEAYVDDQMVASADLLVAEQKV